MIEGGIFGVPEFGPAEFPPVVMMMDEGDDIWHTATCTDIPSDSKAVHLCGILIITYGSHDLSESCDLHLRIRAPGAPVQPDYVGQVVEVRSGGVRSPFACWCAVKDRQFEYHWTRSTPPSWPEHASYGFKLYADAYLR